MVLTTHGAVHNEREICERIEQNKKMRTRFLCPGIGSSCNWFFLRMRARTWTRTRTASRDQEGQTDGHSALIFNVIESAFGPRIDNGLSVELNHVDIEVLQNMRNTNYLLNTPDYCQADDSEESNDPLMDVRNINVDDKTRVIFTQDGEPGAQRDRRRHEVG